MKVIEFLAYCPPDHDITIFIDKMEESFFMKNRTDVFALGISFELIIYADINFIHADSTKSFYITASL